MIEGQKTSLRGGACSWTPSRRVQWFLLLVFAVISLFALFLSYPVFFVADGVLRNVTANWHALVLVSVACTLLLTGIGFLQLTGLRTRERRFRSDLMMAGRKYCTLSDLFPFGVFSFDTQGKCAFANERFLTITGRSRKEILGASAALFIHPDDFSGVIALLEEKSGYEEAIPVAYRLLRPDGEVASVIGAAKAEQDECGRIQGYVVAQKTAFRQAGKEVEYGVTGKLEAQLPFWASTGVSANVLHDLKQPVQAINLFNDALNRTLLSDEQKKLVNLIASAARTLGDSLKSLQDISRLDAGLVRPRLEKVDPAGVFKLLDEEFSARALQQNLRLKFFFPMESLFFETDPELLNCVLHHLINHAFMQKKSSGILVGVRKRKNSGLIQVWTLETSIAPDVGDKLFRARHQTAGASGYQPGGAEMGLAIAQRTARLLGSHVSFRSRQGRGMVFEIKVPFANVMPRKGREGGVPKQLDATKIDAGVDTFFCGWSVMIVDDDPVVVKSLELSLQGVGVKVSAFQSAEEAMASPSSLEMEFYISDFLLPGMNGAEFLDAIRKRRGVPIHAILMTGDAVENNRKDAVPSHWRVISKPAELSHLLAAMRDVVARAESAARSFPHEFSRVSSV